MFGGARALAEALGITVQAVNQWGEHVPRLRVHHIRALCSEGGDPAGVLAELQTARALVADLRDAIDALPTRAAPAEG